MKTSIILSTVIAAAGLVPMAQADISIGFVPPSNAAPIQGNCDLLASNTVRATFKGVQEITVPNINGTANTTKVAVFEVIENLAHRRISRYGDGAMPAGMVFQVELTREMPGQPAEIVDLVSQFQPGEEAVLRMDHLFLYGNPEGCFLRPCGRMARRTAPQPAADPSAAPTQAPGVRTITISGPGITGHATISGTGTTQFSSHSYSEDWQDDGNGNRTAQKVETTQEYDPATGKVNTRMFINGIEVDPQTKQPLKPTIQIIQPEEPAPAVPVTPDDPNDDTIIES